jgi:hypothetical protein
MGPRNCHGENRTEDGMPAGLGKVAVRCPDDLSDLAQRGDDRPRRLE